MHCPQQDDHIYLRHDISTGGLRQDLRVGRAPGAAQGLNREFTCRLTCANNDADLRRPEQIRLFRRSRCGGIVNLLFSIARASNLLPVAITTKMTVDDEDEEDSQEGKHGEHTTVERLRRIECAYACCFSRLAILQLFRYPTVKCARACHVSHPRWDLECLYHTVRSVVPWQGHEKKQCLRRCVRTREQDGIP